MARTHPGDLPTKLDIFTAFLAGEGSWNTEARVPMAIRIAALVQTLGLVTYVTAVVSWVPEHSHHVNSKELFFIASLVAVTSAIFFMIGPLGLVLGRRQSGHPATVIAVRGLLSLVLFMCTAVVFPGWHALAALPLGIAGGADTAMTRWALGLDFEMTPWWLRAAVSPSMLGVTAAAVLLAATSTSGEHRNSILALYLTVHLALLLAAGTLWVLYRMRDALEQHTEDLTARIRAEEHRLRAHWLHDEVCAELQLTSLRLRIGDLDPTSINRELADLDHRLRLRQAEEFLMSGDVRLAELVQPHLRRAQSVGVRLTEVPSYEVAQLHLDPTDARLFARVVSVLVSNALNAGTATLGLTLEHGDDWIEVTVLDDVGGFPPGPLPLGRGLEQLTNELGEEALEVSTCTLGSRVTMRLHHAGDPTYA